MRVHATRRRGRPDGPLHEDSAVPIYAYRCRHCGGETDAFASINDPPVEITCEHCDSTDTHRIIARVAYHASENAKTARLDPKYEKKVDHALRKSANADPDRLMRRLPFPPKGPLNPKGS